MSSAEYGQLVEFLGRQFAEVGRQFADVDRRFDELDRRFTEVIAELRQEMLGHFDAIDRRFERLEQEYQAILQALRRIETRLTDEAGRREILVRDLTELKHRVAELQSRIDDIDQRLGR
jgi:chromosome segregation ATPase